MPQTQAPHGACFADAIHVLILENAIFAREGVEPLLRPHGDIQVVGMAGDLSLAVRMANLFPPDVVIVNLDDGSDTARIVRYLRKRVPDARVLVMLGGGDPAFARTLRHAGADELLFGAQRPASVVGSVRQLGYSARPGNISRYA